MMGGNGSAGVAIVGIACRFPGAADHSAFWRNLCEGVESISALSDEGLVSAGVPADQPRKAQDGADHHAAVGAYLTNCKERDVFLLAHQPKERVPS